MLKKMIWAVIVTTVMIPMIANAAFQVDSILRSDIKSPILDMAAKPNDDMVFVLTPGAVLVYSVEEQKIMDQIHVDKHFNGIAYQEDDRLILSANDPSMLSILQIRQIFPIDVKNRAVKGPRDAKATIVVFDDYQ